MAKSTHAMPRMLTAITIIGSIGFIFAIAAPHTAPEQQSKPVCVIVGPITAEPQQHTERATVTAVETVAEPYYLTAYCSCERCCGKWSSCNHNANGDVIGAAGQVLKQGVSVGADLPFGTILYIDGLGNYIVQDRPADYILKKYDGKILDVYFNNHEDALAFGRKIADVTIVGRLP